MHAAVARLRTPEECEEFARATQQRDPELAAQARRRKVELRAAHHRTQSVAEQEALKAIYAYEEVLSVKRGRRTPASRTWQMVKRHGIIGAVERAVNRTTDASGYTALAEIGMLDLSFEAVVLHHPNSFSADALARAKERLADWSGAAHAS
jgi:hypothetical protein